MFSKFQRIFQRYAHENIELDLPRPAFASQEALQIDLLKLRQNRLIVEGWTRHDEIGLSLKDGTVWSRPNFAASKPEDALSYRFSISAPFALGKLNLIGKSSGSAQIYPLENMSAQRLAWAKTRLAPRYVLQLFGLLPQAYRWKMKGDMGARELIKERLNLVPKRHVLELQADIFQATELARPYKGATIVLPIYNALDYLKEALARIEAHSDLSLHLILIEDCSPDPSVRPFVEAWAKAPERRFGVTLLLNDQNLGFIGTSNRGLSKAMEIAPDHPVILFNSDAMVPKDWVSRLLAPLADPSVASVTPMSNDAEIFNIPVACQRLDLALGMVDELDAVARKISPTMQALAPTGVGFCMALAPQFIRNLPQLDTIYGRGYGEENDWCQRAIALGGKHIGIGNLFVEHRGGSSFGSEAKRLLIEKNVAELVRRFPTYPEQVQSFLRDDPIATARLALGIAWAGLQSFEPVTIWLAHAMGGGAEHDLMRRIKAITEKGGASLVLRVGLPHRWQLELHSPFGVTQGATNDFDLIKSLVALLPKRRVIYSCGVGDPAPASLPAHLAALAGHEFDQGPSPIADEPQPIEVWFHDFFPISPSFTLVGSDGLFQGLPKAQDPAHSFPRRGAHEAVSLADWQAAWGDLIAVAQNVVTFSQSSRDLVAAVWPDHAEKIQIRPHDLIHNVPKIASQRQKDRIVIGVLGNINHAKGAVVLQKLSKRLKQSNDMGLVVIGQMDPIYPLKPPAEVHGGYQVADLPLLVERYGITAWFIPSIWPETFSFTTHEVLATGMPVFAFDIGAQADAIRPALAEGRKGGLLPISKAMELDSEDFRSQLSL